MTGDDHVIHPFPIDERGVPSCPSHLPGYWTPGGVVRALARRGLVWNDRVFLCPQCGRWHIRPQR